ncbi:MAG TPA: hypothetical protein VMW29_00195 [Candidatus Bathyarchaeia archaeon]|nr:hypothetical protein [Candidatus Bathyarchaeia archaeon]
MAKVFKDALEGKPEQWEHDQPITGLEVGGVNALFIIRAKKGVRDAALETLEDDPRWSQVASIGRVNELNSKLLEMFGEDDHEPGSIELLCWLPGDGFYIVP